MKAHFQSVNFTADGKLLSFIQRKLDKLELFHPHIIEAQVFLKVDPRQRVGNKQVEIKLQIPGKELVAKKQAGSFEKAADEGAEALRRQLRKKKPKGREVVG